MVTKWTTGMLSFMSLPRDENNSEVTKSHPEDDDDIEFSMG